MVLESIGTSKLPAERHSFAVDSIYGHPNGGNQVMAKLKDIINERGEFYELPPPFIIQLIEPADYVAEQILEHLKYGYHLTSLTALNTGPHGGRLLLLFHRTN
jgi:hypothetical protein